MRVAVDYRILAGPDNLMARGIGRYTQQQLAAVLALDGETDYHLLCPPGADLSLVLPEIRHAENVTAATVTFSEAVEGSDPNDSRTLLRRAAELEQWVHDRGIDLYHASAPFVLDEAVFASFDACPIVATIYDLIPLVFPDHYLFDDEYRRRYLRALGLVGGATRLLAISGTTRDDAVSYLGVPPSRIDIASPFASSCFTPLEDRAVEDALSGLAERVTLPERYVLAVSDLHHSKNLDLLFRAYSMCSSTLRERIALVVCCHLDGGRTSQVLQLAADAGVSERVVLTGGVSDRELAGLYNRATFTVHPSRYEGFGLPVLEAMQCAVPVVTTTASSLPEVAGGAAILVDPDDPTDLAGAMERLHSDHSLRADLAERGSRRAARFNPEELGRAALRSYRAALDAPAPPGRHRVALWSPLPPPATPATVNGVALADGLSRRCEVEIFVDDGVAVCGHPALTSRARHHRSFPRRHVQAPFDSVVYQVGADHTLRYATDGLLASGGYAVLHDVDGLLSSPDLLDAILSASTVQFVTTPSAGHAVSARYPEAPISTILPGVEDPCWARPRRAARMARDRLHVGADAFVVGLLGMEDEPGLVEECIEALGRLSPSPATTHVVALGDDPRHRESVAELAGGLALRPVEAHPRPQWATGFLACDVVVNLRLEAREVGSVMLALAASNPLLLGDCPEAKLLPEAVRDLVPAGPGRVARLAELLSELAGDHALRERRAARARAFFEAEATIATMTDRYLEAMTGSCRNSGLPRGRADG